MKYLKDFHMVSCSSCLMLTSRNFDINLSFCSKHELGCRYETSRCHKLYSFANVCCWPTFNFSMSYSYFYLHHIISKCIWRVLLKSFIATMAKQAVYWFRKYFDGQFVTFVERVDGLLENTLRLYVILFQSI